MVIVDAPAVLGLADASVIASLCKATLMVDQSGVQRRPVQYSICRLLEANIKIAGVVLNKFSARNAAYGNGERYGENSSSRPLIDMAA